jgi:hypothetical protein
VLEQSLDALFERKSRLSEAKEGLSESFGSTEVSFDRRRSSLTAMARQLGCLSGAGERRLRKESSLEELLQAL